ncbi:MAG: NADH-quinone oxidoreductase subunit H [Polyangiaceae bacterium]
MASILLLVAAAAGCAGRRNVPELLTLTDVAPTKIDYGERVDVMGVDLPAADVRQAHVTLRGDLFRPGRPALRNQTIVIEDAVVRSDRVSFDLTDTVAERIMGRGEETLHTTFRGTVEVSLPSTSSNVPVLGTLRGVTVLDFNPRTPGRAILDERAREAEAARAFMGVEIDAASGVLVTAVVPSSPADRAGIHAGDRLVAFDGVTVESELDVIPSGAERSLEVVVDSPRTDPLAEPGAPPTRATKTLDLEGWKSDTTRDLVAPVLVLGSLLVVLLALGTRLAKVLTWLERRVERGTARHRRDADSALRRWSAFVRSVVADHGDKDRGTDGGALATSAPYIVFVCVSATFALVPWVELHRRAEIDLGVLYLMSFVSYVTMALVTGGHDAGKRWSIMGSIRSFARAIACELPAALAIAAVVVQTGSLHIRDLAIAQTGPSSGSIFEAGAWPWYFRAIKSPQLLLMFAMFFVTVVAEPSARRAANEAPAPASTLTAFRRTAFFFAEWANVFVMCAIAAALFLGGWYVPGFSPAQHESSAMLGWAGTGLYLVKSWILVAVVMTKRVSLPRLRADLVLRFALRFGLPASIVGLGLTAIQTFYPPMPTVALMMNGVTLAASTILVFLFVTRMISASRARERSGSTKTASTALI